MAKFPTRRDKSVESSDEDYAVKSHKKKFFSKIGDNTRATPDADYVDSEGAWRRGAAKRVVTYDEAQADYGLETDEDVVYYPEEQGVAEGTLDRKFQALLRRF